MDLSDIILRSLMLSVVTLILHVGVIASASPTPRLNATTVTVTTPNNNVTEIQSEAGPTTGLPSNTTTEAMTTSGPDMKTSGPTTKPQIIDTTTAGDMTTKAVPATTAGPTKPAKNNFRVGTFFCVIILIACLIGIGFCGYQFYRKRQNDSYHTL